MFIMLPGLSFIKPHDKFRDSKEHYERETAEENGKNSKKYLAPDATWMEARL